MRLLFTSFTMLALCATVQAQVWNEVGDADEVPGFEQDTTGAGVLVQLNGYLQDLEDGKNFCFDDVDMYLIQIPDPATFSVNMIGTDLDGALDDTMLWIFDAAGNLVVFDDDDGPGNLSQINAGELAGFPAGNYLIAVSLFATTPGDDPVTYWNRDATPCNTGPYVLNFPVAPPPAQKLDTNHKGSLLIFPKVELRFSPNGDLLQDTYLQLGNDFTEDVHVLTYFISDTCDHAYIDIDLTKNQPIFWSVATGQPLGVSPLGGLIPAVPDPATGDLVIRGAYIVFAANEQNQQIRWNHLTGLATIINYAEGSAYEYYPYASQVVDGQVPNGGVVGVPGSINMDGLQYQAPPALLVMDFQAAGATSFSGAGRIITHDTAVALMMADVDLRQDNINPLVTKAKYYIWNGEEISYTAEYCFDCWDCRRLGEVGGIFLTENLQTQNGRAAIDGLASNVCNPDLSYNSALLGVAVKVLTFDNNDVTKAADTLWGRGLQAAAIRYDVPPPPEEHLNGAKVGSRGLRGGR